MISAMLARLTDAYTRDPDSTLGRLLQVLAGELEDAQAALETTRDWRDIDQAEGATLDRIGANFEQYRGAAEDSVYRVLLKSKLARNLSDGAVDTIISVLAITLQADPQDISIEELWPGEPAAVHIDIPAASLLVAGMSLTQFGRFANRVVAAGVRASIFTEGTFELATEADPAEEEYDTEAGFNELDEFGDPGDIGGRLGAVYDPADDPDLPF